MKETKYADDTVPMIVSEKKLKELLENVINEMEKKDY